MSDSAKFFQPEVLSRISRLELRARRVVEGFVSGMHESPYRGFSVEFATHRQYSPGDDIRHIDWRVYGKADRYFIKEYEVETNMRTHVLLDCSASMVYPDHEGSERMNKWTYAATVAASLAMLVARQQDAVGLTLFDDGVRARFAPSSNRGMVGEMIKAIEAENPGGTSDVGSVFQVVAGSVPRRGMVVIVSDLLFDVDSFIAGLQRLRFDGHDIVVLQVLDDDEITFPFTDRTRFEGIENDELEVMADPQSLRGAYLEALQAYLHRVRSVCLNQGIDYQLVSTADRLDVSLTRYLAARMHRQRSRT